MFIGLTGISGVGKTTLINSLSKKIKCKKVSSTLLLMKMLGIIDETATKPSAEDYLRLEGFNEDIVNEAYASDKYLELLKVEDDNESIIIFEIHFESPGRKKYNITYREIPNFDWYKIFKATIYLTSNVESIIAHKLKDISEGERDRGISTSSYKSVAIQKFISDLAWEEYKTKFADQKTVEIENVEGEIDKTTAKVLEIINLL